MPLVELGYRPYGLSEGERYEAGWCGRPMRWVVCSCIAYLVREPTLVL